MRLTRPALARVATIRALRIRRAAGLRLLDPVCVYDLAERLGLEVRFWDVPSMEGVYCVAATPTIIVSSLRPPGRQAFTCAHELGHHVFGHGDQLDELVEDRSEARRLDPKEFQADCFAGALLMPRPAVSRGFSVRGWEPATCPPEGFYVVATWLGVGYTTLIQHMHRALGMLDGARAEELRRRNLAAIRARLFDGNCTGNLIVAAASWSGRAIDAHVADVVLLPPHARLEGHCAEIRKTGDTGTVAEAIRAGLGRVVTEASDWSAYLRVSRRSYVGRAKYRFEEDVDDGDP